MPKPVITDEDAEVLRNIKSMRDIHDFCTKRGLPSLAQGMIELTPPAKLQQTAAQVFTSDGVHTYRNRIGEPEFLNALTRMMKNANGEEVAPENILACPGVTGGVIAALLTLKARKGHTFRCFLGVELTKPWSCLLIVEHSIRTADLGGEHLWLSDLLLSLSFS